MMEKTARKVSKKDLAGLNHYLFTLAECQDSDTEKDHIHRMRHILGLAWGDPAPFEIYLVPTDSFDEWNSGQEKD